MEKTVEAHHLRKFFGTFEAVKGISFEVFTGEIFGLLGPNGAGKTTTLRMLAGILQPSEGSSFIAGHSMQNNRLQAGQELGFLTGDMNLYERLNPIEILTYFAELYQVPKNEIRPRVEELVEMFEMQAFAKRLSGKLSTGQKQRVAIARTLVHHPKVIILDEPTTGLDIMASEMILNFIQKVAREQNKTVIFSTHNLSEVERLCQRIGIIHRGSLIALGEVAQVKAQKQQESLAAAFFELVSGEVSEVRIEGTDVNA